MKKLLLITLLISGIFANSAMAYRGDYGRGNGYGRGGHHHHGGGDFEAGFVAGLFMSTASLFMSEITAYHSEAVYLNADQDAAEYLAQGGEPTPALAQAMDYERGFLARAQVGVELSDQEVAYLVMRRAEAL